MKRYNVVINGMATTLQLSDRDAAAMGFTAPEEKGAEKVAEKARVAPANKSRTPRNKQA